MTSASVHEASPEKKIGSVPEVYFNYKQNLLKTRFTQYDYNVNKTLAAFEKEVYLNTALMKLLSKAASISQTSNVVSHCNINVKEIRQYSEL